MHENLKLVLPTMAYEKEIQDFRQEFITRGDTMHGCSSLQNIENISDWIQQVEDFSSPETCPKDRVPQTQFLCVREEDGKVVGMIQLRHYLSQYLKRYGGHIGYSVRPSERRQGYGAWMLKKVLSIGREMGLPKILVTCTEDNEASKRVIKKNGGVYESTIYESKNDRYLEKYWIDLKKPT